MIVNDENFKRLNSAVTFLDIDTVKSLIEKQKIDVNTICSDGKNILYNLFHTLYLTANLNCQINLQAILKKNTILTMLEYLIEKGIDINFRAPDGMNVLLWSSMYGDLDIIKILFKYNVSLNVYNLCYYKYDNIQNDYYCINGYYPIHFASMHGHYQIVDFLLNQKVDVDLFSNKINTIIPKTSLQIAILHSHYETLILLLKHGADPKRIIGFNYPSLLLTIHGINIFSKYSKNYNDNDNYVRDKYDLRIVGKLLEFEYNIEYNNNLYEDIYTPHNSNQSGLYLSKLSLNGADYYIETAKFLFHNDSNIARVDIKLIFNYAIKYQMLPLAIKILNIFKKIPAEQEVYLACKEIMRRSNLGRIFDATIIACKYGLKGSNNKNIPLEIVHNIITFSYGHYVHLQTLLSTHKFKYDISNDNDETFEQINNRINKIYSYKKKI